MPLYEYQCKQCGHRFEKIQSFSAPDEKECPKCQGELERLISAPALQFKGSGFYLTDYGKAGSTAASRSGASEGAGAGSSEGKSGSSAESSGAAKSSDGGSAPASPASAPSSGSSGSGSGGSTSSSSGSNSNTA